MIVKGDDLGSTCRRNGKDDKCTKNFLWKERDDMGDLGVYEMITVKCFIEKYGMRMWTVII
jgi:hypothetical protein